MTRLAPSPLALLLLLPFALPVEAQVATALLVEGQPVPGAPAGAIAFSLTGAEVNRTGGSATAVGYIDDGGGFTEVVWGSFDGSPGTVLFTPGTYDGLAQDPGTLTEYYAISDDGRVAYSIMASDGTGPRLGLWIDEEVVALDGESVLGWPVEERFWGWALGPAFDSVGSLIWWALVRTSPASGFEENALFSGAGQVAVLYGTQAVPGLPFPVDVEGVSTRYSRSADGSHLLSVVDMDTDSQRGALVYDGVGYEIDGQLVRVGEPLPAAAGGLPGDTWDLFSFPSANEAGDTLFISGGYLGVEELLLVKNGVVLHRAGDVIDGKVLGEDMDGVRMNEQGNVAMVWKLEDGSDALFLDGQLLLEAGDPVDLDGDGVPEEEHRLMDILIGASTDKGFALSDRSPLGELDICFIAKVEDVSDSPRRIFEAFFCLEVGASECFLVLGPGPGTTAFDPQGTHTFWPQLASVDAYQPVLLDNVGEIPLPVQHAPAPALGGATLVSSFPDPVPVSIFAAQVLMWNPSVFPQDPEQYSPGLTVAVFPNGHVRAREYGTGTGMTLGVVRGVNVAGQPVLRFPFSIPGF